MNQHLNIVRISFLSKLTHRVNTILTVILAEKQKAEEGGEIGKQIIWKCKKPKNGLNNLEQSWRICHPRL